MGIDITVLIEHKIGDDWVLVDVDPIYSSERNSFRREELYKISGGEVPTDLSKGTNYWLSGETALNFVVCLDIKKAAEIWYCTDGSNLGGNFNFQSACTTFFGVWEPKVSEWRVIVAI